MGIEFATRIHSRLSNTLASLILVAHPESPNVAVSQDSCLSPVYVPQANIDYLPHAHHVVFFQPPKYESTTSLFFVKPMTNATGIPWMFPLPLVSGVLISACESTQTTAISRPNLSLIALAPPTDRPDGNRVLSPRCKHETPLLSMGVDLSRKLLDHSGHPYID
jgi:hypothetical protein